MRLADYIASDPEGAVWDVVVVGTGAGGGPAGLRLARSGKSVLFLERNGAWENTEPTSAEPRLLSIAGEVEYAGHSEDVYSTPHHAKCESEFQVGGGVGGTTTLFSMAMDRFQPADFAPYRFAHLAPDSTLPDVWPVQYEELDSYYREAETLFRIRGSLDPITPIRGELLDPLTPSETERSVFETLIRSKLHPYAMHYAREHLPECDGCHNKYCSRPCRNHAGRMCVIPALVGHGARILTNCLVTRLKASGRIVRHAVCSWNGRTAIIRARIFILALNALSTPALLLRSANESFPDGLGNSSGMIGRNLMTHVSDVLAVRMKGVEGAINGRLSNGVSINDFYFRDDIKLGNIHAHAADLSSSFEE